MDLHEEAGKKDEQTLPNLCPTEETTSKNEVEIEKLSMSLFLCFIVLAIY